MDELKILAQMETELQVIESQRRGLHRIREVITAYEHARTELPRLEALIVTKTAEIDKLASYFATENNNVRSRLRDANADVEVKINALDQHVKNAQINAEQVISRVNEEVKSARERMEGLDGQIKEKEEVLNKLTNSIAEAKSRIATI